MQIKVLLNKILLSIRKACAEITRQILVYSNQIKSINKLHG